MRKYKICMLVLLHISIVTISQAQQSAFQGIWMGEVTQLYDGRVTIDRSSHRIEISGNNWSHFENNIIQAGGTAKFSPGQAELLLANGNTYFNFTLLAPGYIEQPTGPRNGLYRFRLRSTINNSNQATTPDSRPVITLVNTTGSTIWYVYIKASSSNDWGNDILDSGEVLGDGQSVRIRLGQPLNVTNRYDIAMVNPDNYWYRRSNVLVSNNEIITMDDWWGQ